MSQQMNYARHGARCKVLSGGNLKVPKTPVERIMLGAKLYRLKLEAQQRREAKA